MLNTGRRALSLGRVRTTSSSSSAQACATVSTSTSPTHPRLPCRYEPTCTVRKRNALPGLLPSVHHDGPLPRHVSYPIRPRSFSTNVDNTVDTASPSLSSEDTIYALSTAHGRAGIAVIRISGTCCLDVYRSLCPSKPVPKPRYAAVRTLATQTSDGLNVLDSSALVLYFPAPKTVTGEDVLELHVHGGPATVKAVLSAIPQCGDLSGVHVASLKSDRGTVRYAEPGEFTRRAFLNDRLDLAQVESLGDTLAADTEQQRRAAVRGNSGALGRTYDDWRHRLLLARGEIEALIDFSEDQHFDESPTELLGNVSTLVRHMLRDIAQHEAAGTRTELLRSGIRIALLGPPNAGKSSLMNLIVGREASIVSVEAGTTRDIVEVSLDIRGFLCLFADTAGFRGQTSVKTDNLGEPVQIGIVEEEGIRRAKQKALESDLIVVLAAVEPTHGGGHRIAYDEETLHLAARAQSCLLVVNKRDVVSPVVFSQLVDQFQAEVCQLVPPLAAQNIIAISCQEAGPATSRTNPVSIITPSQPLSALDPGGIHAFIDRLISSFTSMTSLPPDMQELLGVTERQRQLLQQCRACLEEYMAVALAEDVPEGQDPDIVLAAEHLRYAAECLAKITGRGDSGDVEDVLGVIFEKFCVGK